MASADLLLHPVRLRIVQAFLGDRTLTTTELRAELPDIPSASLYRHIALLVDAGELAEMTTDDHRQAFMAFVAGLLGDFDRYLARGDIDLVRDGVGYRLAGVWLDDAEYAELLRELTRVLQPKLAHPPGPGRKRRILGYVLMPGSEAAPHPAVSHPDDEAASRPGGHEPRADPPSPNPTRRNP